MFGAPAFSADSVVLSYSSLEAAKKWWIDAFDCKVAKVPANWDNHLPSDIALKFPGCDEPTISAVFQGRNRASASGGSLAGRD